MASIETRNIKTCERTGKSEKMFHSNVFHHFQRFLMCVCVSVCIYVYMNMCVCVYSDIYLYIVMALVICNICVCMKRQTESKVQWGSFK